MRAYSQGSLLRVTADARDVSSFRAQWPASGLGSLRSVSAIFDRGDLVDLYTNGTYGAKSFDGDALLALISDMEKYGKSKLSTKRRSK